jgi:hypothetical protein
VNRLLLKNDRVKETMGSFQIRRDLAQIIAEYWDLPKLQSLLTPSQVTTDLPARVTGAIVVVRREILEFLIDGRRRVNYWKSIQSLGPHRVLVVYEQADGI